MTDLMVEVLDFDWVRKGITGRAQSATITRELGAVGDAEVVLPIDDKIISVLPDPDENNPYEGRFKIYEDSQLKFAGVIDSTSIRIDETNATVSFSGKQRGIELGFHNTGRIDYLGWSVGELFEELLRDNIAKAATIESVTSEDDLYPAYAALSGDPFKANYWKTTGNLPENMIVDLGEAQEIVAIRVLPQWWKDQDTKEFHYHKFEIAISDDASSWNTVYTKDNANPSSSRGHLYEGTHTTRYVRLRVNESTDGIARIAQLMVYKKIADLGTDTSYITPFIENDDSGNMNRAGDTERPVIPGAFQGDSVITKSFVTRLNDGGSIRQTFRGVSSAVYFTSAKSGGDSTVNIYVDGDLRVSDLVIPNQKYWFKGYDTLDDMGLLSDAQHTLKVEQVTGKPQVDYFSGLYRTSWRPIEDDDPSLAYKGKWSAVEAPYYHNYFSAKSSNAGDELHFTFRGDRIRVIGSKVDNGGSFTAFIDGNNEGSIDVSGAGEHKQVLFNWEGAYGDHRLRLDVTDAPVFIDRLEGNLMHTMYIRSRYEPNLKVLIRLSEILDSYVRFNDDGSVDLLGAVGDPVGVILREGENEGGNIINLQKEHDYSETGSVCLALVNVNGELPIKAMVIDRQALREIGWKVIKLENSDAADQFLLNRQALQFLRDHRKPSRAYNMSYEGEEIDVGLTARVYAPSADMGGNYHRIGKITTEYTRD